MSINKDFEPNHTADLNPIDFAPRKSFEKPEKVPTVHEWQKQGRRPANLGEIDKSARKQAERQALNGWAAQINAQSEIAPEASQIIEPLPIRNPHEEFTPLQERLRMKALEDLSKPRDRDVSNA